MLYHDKAGSDKPLEMDMKLDGKPLRMEVDTGAAVSLLSEKTYQSLFPRVQLLPLTMKPRTYSREPLTVVGQQEVEFKHGEQLATLPLLVVQGKGPSLLGRNWDDRQIMVFIYLFPCPALPHPKMLRGGVCCCFLNM